MIIKPVSYHQAALAKNIFFALFSAESGSTSGGPKESLAKEKIFLHLPASHQTSVKKLAQEEFRAEDGETKSIWFPQGPIKRILLFGLGEKIKWNFRREHLLPRALVRYAKNERITEFTTNLSVTERANQKEAARRFTVNAVLADFDFNKYKERPKKGWPEIKTIYLAADKKDFAQISQGIREGMIIGEEANHCRTLANTPGGDMTPARLAEAAARAVKTTGVKIKILEEKDIKRLGMGGILGVSKGSEQKPKFIIMEYRHGPKIQKPLVIVGKGVTFDTGGLSLKPRQGLYEMHMDMSGGAAAIHGIAAIARLRLPVNVISLIPAVENMVSGASFRPGDILKTLSGKTIEVLNTDAEGRIILADALTYANRYQPGLMVDIATLTGAAEVALGTYCSAIFTNKEILQKKLTEIGEKSGEYVWPFPLWEEYLTNIKGVFGDLANIEKEGAMGGAIYGAKFLEQFVDKTPWAHIDIAPRMTANDQEFLAKGASGVGVRYIVELAKCYSEILTSKL